MITVERLPEPDILKEKKEEWTARYLERCREGMVPRPSSSQYRHPKILDTLESMSFHKCFYCEAKIARSQSQVDHYVEVALSPERAFLWENLYLSCRECNGCKLSHEQVPVDSCLNPCDVGEQTGDHLTFDDEFIGARHGSLKRMQTIQKYKLDRDTLNHQRVKQLRDFERLLRVLLQRQMQEGNRPLHEAEKEIIRKHKQKDHPFSLMFEVYLSRHNV